MERKKVPGLPIPPAPEPMPHLDLATPSSRRVPKLESNRGSSRMSGSSRADANMKEGKKVMALSAYLMIQKKEVGHV